jgi:hypothetical protein
MDKNGYPVAAELESIQEWPVDKGYSALMEYVKELWHWDDYFDEIDEKNFELHTGGWSGNEEIIEALMSNQMFWSLCWKESTRGGHYKFELYIWGGEK